MRRDPGGGSLFVGDALGSIGDGRPTLKESTCRPPARRGGGKREGRGSGEGNESRLAGAMLLGLSSAAIGWQKPAGVSPDPPPREPISLELVGDRTVMLDRMGMTRADWIKAAKDGRLPPLPTGLKMRIQNN